MTSTATISGRSLLRSFGQGENQSIALRDVQVDCHAGQLILLMGPSGSGKSTLLSVLGGLLRPDSGQVEVLGRDLWGVSDRERKRIRLDHFGFIFQGFNLFASLSAYQQLELVLRWGQGVSVRVAKPRVNAMLDRLGLARKAHLRPCELSGGEKQRVAIGRALIKEPELCFADEPTSALDWVHGQRVVEFLKDAAHERGATVLVVSHDSRLVPYADRVIHMADGSLEETRAAA